MVRLTYELVKGSLGPREGTPVPSTVDTSKAEQIREAVRNELRQRFGREPSDADVEWGSLNRLRLQHGIKNNWKLYRDTTYAMAKQLLNEGKAKEALAFYLEVAFYDLNAPRDCGGHEAEWMRMNAPFNPEYGNLTNYVLAPLQEIRCKLMLDKSALKEAFVQRIKQVRQPNMPLSIDGAWAILGDKLGDKAIQPPGYFEGRHYTSAVEEAKTLNRKGALEEEVKLLLKAVEATEREAEANGWPVAPYYFKRLAIVYRKQKKYLAEQQILERYLHHVPHDEEAQIRLTKARLLLEKSRRES